MNPGHQGDPGGRAGQGAPAPCVLVTRPRGQGEAWIRALRAAGLRAEALPLLGIAPPADASPLRAAAARLASFDLVMFVSPTAVARWFAEAPGWPEDRPMPAGPIPAPAAKPAGGRPATPGGHAGDQHRVVDGTAGPADQPAGSSAGPIAGLADLTEGRLAEMADHRVAELAGGRVTELAGGHAAELADGRPAELAGARVAEGLAGPVLPPGPWAAATGPGTVQALLRAGVPPGRIVSPAEAAGRFDSEALWAVLQPMRRWTQARVLIVRGEGGRPWLAEALAAAGAEVQAVAAYRRLEPNWTADEAALAARALADPAGHLWLFSSSEAVGHLPSLLPGADWLGQRAIATHARIAEAARQIGLGEVLCVPPDPAAVAAAVRGGADAVVAAVREGASAVVAAVLEHAPAVAAVAGGGPAAAVDRPPVTPPIQSAPREDPAQ